MKNNLTLSGIAIIIATLALLILNPINAKAQTQTIKPIYQRVSASVGGYYESLPVNYSSEPDKKYPLLIFLHGSGEKGDGSPSALPRVLRNGPPKLLNQGNFPDKFIYNGEAFSFIVVAPQTAGGTGSGATIRDMINHSLKTYRVDEQRIYLTGLSLGGLRTYNYAAYKKELTDKIAAILLVAPNAYSKEERARTIASSNVPVWLTNNDGDPLARISGAIRTVDMINAYKPIPRAKLTVFNKYGHDAWTQSYDPAFKEDGMNVYEWMLSYTTPRNRPSPLVASAGADKTITLPLDSAVLDGSVSTTGTNALKAYEWNYVNGPATPVISSPLQKTIVVKNLVEGTYTFSLKVTGSEGNSDLDTVSVIVKPISIPGHQLVANAGADQIITLPVTQTTFDGSASFAASGQTIDAYLWKKISGPIRQGTITDTKSAATTVTNFIPGVYTYQLTVTDDAGNIQADTVKITVNYKTGVLKADAGRDTTLILPQKYMPLDGSNSTAPEGSNIRCAWKRIAGPGASSGVMYPSSNLVTTAGRPAPGTYVYRLIVRDDKGNKDVDYITITVKTAEEA
ncbi:MAG: PKD domain-containing protein, partial [Agriterribacter sp.]